MSEPALSFFSQAAREPACSHVIAGPSQLCPGGAVEYREKKSAPHFVFCWFRLSLQVAQMSSQILLFG
jgi:hypothetical protein